MDLISERTKLLQRDAEWAALASEGSEVEAILSYWTDDAVVLRNYEGMLVRYQAEDKPNTVQPTKTRGVSSLLQGSKTLLMPEQNERMVRRQLHLLTHEEPKAYTDRNGHNCCEGNGHEEGLVAVNTAGEKFSIFVLRSATRNPRSKTS